MQFKTALLVGIGGGIGSIARFLCQKFIIALYPSAFPLGTFLVNITGCFLIGLFFGLSVKNDALTADWKLFLTTGFCGGFTTFSAFAYENINLLKSGDLSNFFLYTIGSIVLGLAATYLGMVLIKLV